MNLRVTLNAGNFVTTLGTISYAGSPHPTFFSWTYVVIYIEGYSSYRAVNTRRFVFKNQSVLCREIIAAKTDYFYVSQKKF
jgi:hypothetical protein